MGKQGLASQDVARRIRLVHAGQRRLKPQHFEAVAAATLGRRRLRVRHFNRERGDTTTRDISPQRRTDPFIRLGDVWVVSPQVLRPMAESLRIILLDAHKLRQANVGRSERVDQLFNYIASAPFAQRIRTVFDTVTSMHTELDQERRAMTKIWTKRQAQIERLGVSMSTVVGEIQGIAHESVPGLQQIGALEAVTLEDETNGSVN